jgi:NAD(P)H dehydrogenase (quinone)
MKHRAFSMNEWREQSMYAVMGLTGQVGSAVANHLLAKGKQVRGIVRNPEKAAAWSARGVELTEADYNDAAALSAAFRGADGVFAMIPPYFAPSPDRREVQAVISALHAALHEAPPGRVVYLSSIGAQQTSGIGLITALHMLEESMDTLPVPTAALRAGWFMENSAWDVAPAREQGKLYSFLQPLDRSFALVATEDIGRAGAQTLLEDWTGHRRIEVGGPRRYSPNDIAAAFSAALGKPVEGVVVPRDTWKAMFVAQGTAENRTAPRIEMLDAFNSGWIDFGVPGTEKFTGTTKIETAIRALCSKPS